MTFRLVSVFITAAIFSASLLAADNPAPPATPPVKVPENKAFEYVRAHEAELKITPEQDAQLVAWSKEVQAEREKVATDPEIKNLYTQLRAARTAKNDDLVHELNDKLKARRAALGFGERPATGKRVTDFLNEEQRAKLRQMLADKQTSSGVPILKGDEKPDPSAPNPAPKTEKKP